MKEPSFEKEKLNEGTEYDLSFKKVIPSEGVVTYEFKNTKVKFDTSGKNFKELPEIIFGTFDESPEKGSLDQPEEKREGVDMAYISACIQEAMKQEQYTEVWFYPHGDDVVLMDGETDEDFEKRKEKRRGARVRLFRQFTQSITLDPSGYGYRLKI